MANISSIRGAGSPLQPGSLNDGTNRIKRKKIKGQLRNHLKEDGREKVQYTREEALEAAASLEDEKNVPYSVYRCPICYEYHVGRTPKSQKRRLQRYKWESLRGEIELGIRVMSSISAENNGSQAKRNMAINKRSKRVLQAQNWSNPTDAAIYASRRQRNNPTSSSTSISQHLEISA